LVVPHSVNCPPLESAYTPVLTLIKDSPPPPCFLFTGVLNFPRTLHKSSPLSLLTRGRTFLASQWSGKIPLSSLFDVDSHGVKRFRAARLTPTILFPSGKISPPFFLLSAILGALKERFLLPMSSVVYKRPRDSSFPLSTPGKNTPLLNNSNSGHLPCTSPRCFCPVRPGLCCTLPGKRTSDRLHVPLSFLLVEAVNSTIR